MKEFKYPTQQGQGREKKWVGGEVGECGGGKEKGRGCGEGGR